MESRHDSENAEKILFKMRPTELVGARGRAHTRARTGVVVTLGVVQVDVMKEAYTQGLDSEEDDDSLGDQIEPRDVGHNIYILAHQVRGGRRKGRVQV